MRHQLTFTELVTYDAGKPSITVPVTLRVSQARVDCDAKVDTGSSNCIFARTLENSWDSISRAGYVCPLVQ